MIYGAVAGIRASNESHRQQQASLPPAERDIDTSLLLSSCQQYAKNHTRNPSTVAFQAFLSDIERTPGSSRWTTTFTARNDFNLEKTFDFSCRLDADGTLAARISERR